LEYSDQLDQLSNLALGAWADSTQKIYVRYFEKFEQYLNRSLIDHPPNSIEILTFINNSTKSDYSKVQIITALDNMFKMFNITFPSPSLWNFIKRGLVNKAKQNRPPPVNYQEEEIEKIEQEANKCIELNLEKVRAGLITMLMLERFMRPSDVSKIVKKTIRITSTLSFRCRLTKELKSQTKSKEAFTKLIISKNETLIQLMKRYISLTEADKFLFQHPSKVAPLSSQRLSSITKSFLRSINIQLQARDLRGLGSSHYLYKTNDLETVLAQGRWSSSQVWLQHYARTKEQA